jgi:hypothetical protein
MVHIRFDLAPTKVAYTAVAGTTIKLDPGLYYLTSDQDCYVIQCGSGDAADTNDIPLFAKSYLLFRVKDTHDESKSYVSGVRMSSDGTLWAIPARV